jgi:carboxypeptidase C (cathepsin A)
MSRAPATAANRNQHLASAVQEAEERYIAANPESQRLAQLAARRLHGGNTRTTVHFSPFPLYMTAGKGSRLTDAERGAIEEQLSRYTGLDRRYVQLSNLRVDIQHFCKELLRDERRTVGRLDSRLKGIDNESAAAETPDFDPSLAAIRPPYTAMFNQYVRAELDYKTDLTYHILGGGIGPWDWGTGGREGFPDVSGALRAAFSRNPDMKLFVASGHYDLATPYYATAYTLDHLGLEPAERGRVTTREYEAGHMMYIHEAELAKLKKDVSEFIRQALEPAK